MYSLHPTNRNYSHSLLYKSICLIGLIFSTSAISGMSVQGTRVIYPMGDKQHSIFIKNNSANETFLVQSWVETPDGSKTADFVITPPLYLSKPGNENTLRLIRTGGDVKQDRETLYYFVTKAIPSIDKNQAKQPAVVISAATKLKLFVRPKGLTLSTVLAPSKLNFKRRGRQLEVNNPTPYYLTITRMTAGSIPIQGGMVAPFSSLELALPSNAGTHLSYKTISDYGGFIGPTTIWID